MNAARRNYDAQSSHLVFYPFHEAKTILAKQLKQLIEDKDNKNVQMPVIRLEVPVERLDPLTWLKAQENPTRCYFSGRDEHDAEMAGIGVAHMICQQNSTDCGSAFTHIHDHLDFTGKLEGLRYYGGLAFAPGHIDDDWKSFGNCRFFIPRFELRVLGNSTMLACNVLNIKDKHFSPELTREGIEKITVQLDKVKFPKEDGIQWPNPGKLLNRRTHPPFELYKKNLEKVIEEIRAHCYEKTVMARKVDFDFEGTVDPVAILHELKNLPTLRYDFLFQWDGGHTFIGSSPERLYKRESRRIYSEAVAGTRTRGEKEQDDDKLAEELMASDKEQREHDFVITSIEEGLRPFCTSLEVEHKKGLLKLKEGQHLITHFEGELKPGVMDDVLIDTLQPTPAVGGCPLDEALDSIHRFEPFKRGWYAGVIGTVSSDAADFAVGLRSALIHGNRMSLFSGGGIVEGSIPEDEWQEAECKLAHYLEIINNK